MEDGMRIDVTKTLGQATSRSEGLGAAEAVGAMEA
jgi:hypothetical protein